MQPANAQAGELSREDRRLVDQWLRKFETSWDDGTLTRLARELPPSGPLRLSALTELVKADLRQRWHGGHRKKAVEDYLTEFPDLGTAETAPLGLIQAEFQIRRGAGDGITWAELAKRFPRQTEQLRRGLELLWQEPSKPSASVSGADDPTHRPDPDDAAVMRTLRPDESVAEPTPTPKQPPAARLPGSANRYSILKELGRGAMGTVYLAQDTVLKRQVALKIPHFRPGDSPELVQRFIREAISAGTLRHPNICPVYDVGENDGVPFLTMAFIEGQPLSKLIDPRSPLPQRRAAEIVCKLAQGLDEAHRHKIIHRDLKPSNIMMDRRNEPVIMDFGLARQLDQDVRLTNQGSVLGTPAYMSPEQVNGDLAIIGPRSDVYALGVILYELLTGRVPFQGAMGQVMAKILTDTPARPRALRPDIDETLERICLKTMAREIEDRYQSMAELADELGRYLNVATQPSPSVLKARSEPNLAFTGDTIIPPPSLPPKGPPQRRWLLAGLVAGLAVAVVALFGLLMGGLGGEDTVTVAIESDPSGAAVFVGGKRLSGLTGMDVELPPGTYDIRLELDKYRAHSNKLVVRADGQRTFRYPLEKLPADAVKPPPGEVEVTFRSKPGQARVFIDGKDVGSTEARLRLKPGDYKVRLERARYRTLEKNIRVEAGVPPFEFTLERQPRRVMIRSNPTEARVSIDGRPQEKRTDAEVELAVGKYKLLLEKEGYQPLAADFVVPEEGDADLPVYRLVPDKLERYALLVGVRRPTADLPDFLHAEADVIALERLLVASGYKPENVRVLTLRQAPGAPLYPSASAVTAQLRELAGKCGSKDSLLVALCGHAVRLPGDPVSYFCAAESDLKDRKTLVSLPAFYEELVKAKALSRLMLIDGWRHDWVKHKGVPEGLRRARPAEVVSGGTVPVLLSCGKDEVGYEHPDARHGAFYEAVLRGLCTLVGQASDGLAGLVRKRVGEVVSKEYGEVQSPEQFAGLGVGPYLAPGPAPGHFGRGWSALDEGLSNSAAAARNGKLFKAVEEFDKALALAPGFVEAHTLKASALYHLGDFDKAAEACRAALKIDADDARAHGYLAEALTRQKQYDEALKHHARAVALEPNYARAYNTLGQTRLLAGKVDDAINEFSHALALHPKLKAALRNRAIAYLSLKPSNAAAARDDLDLATSLDPKNAEAFYLRGLAHVELKRPDDARRDLNQAITLDPTFGRAYALRAQVHQALNMLKEAEEDRKKAKTLSGGK